MLSSMFYNSLPLFARLLAFFALSPLFSRSAFPLYVRIAISLLFGFFLTTVIQPTTQPTLLLFIRELGVGYLLGFLFSLIFEAASLAGQLVGGIGGFSATELLDPGSNAKDPLISKLFVLTLFTLLFALDGHHYLLQFLFESYTLIPLGEFKGAYPILQTTTSLFSYALQFALIPLTFSGAVIVIFALASRFFPNLQIFWIGFPLQIFIVILAIALAITLFPTHLFKWFSQTIEVLRQTLFSS